MLPHFFYLQPQPEVRCMRFNWPSFTTLNKATPEAAEPTDKEPPPGPFLSIPGEAPKPRGQCHKSNDSVGSCASTRLIVEICESFSGRVSCFMSNTVNVCL